MQTLKTTAATGAPSVRVNTEPLTIRKRIGSIVYEVEIHFCPNARETLNDKIIRLMRRDMEAAS